MQGMLTLPILVLLILGTAILSSIITVALPMVPIWFNAFKTRIKQVFTRKNTKPAIDATVAFNLQTQIDELEEQINNVAKKMTNRESNRKVQVKKIVREYLEELSK